MGKCAVKDDDKMKIFYFYHDEALHRERSEQNVEFKNRLEKQIFFSLFPIIPETSETSYSLHVSI